jgi:hypothetical protein
MCAPFRRCQGTTDEEMEKELKHSAPYFAAQTTENAKVISKD